jgi:glycosyltransferase involved in cell wall biosynthesis
MRMWRIIAVWKLWALRNNIRPAGLPLGRKGSRSVVLRMQNAEIVSPVNATALEARAEHQVPKITVALLTGGGDRPYAYGLATELIARGIGMDLIASDDLDSPVFHGRQGVNFLNLRGDQRPEASLTKKMTRVLLFYFRLVQYAATAKPEIFHILWNNKFQFFDRTLLMLYYKWLGKKIILTVHNVNANVRDSRDSAFNRRTLRFQYQHADHIFVHTQEMKAELTKEYRVSESRVTVIPFGINNSVPNTSLSPDQAKEKLSLRKDEKAILFFGNIAPYKGLEYLVSAYQEIAARRSDFKLIIAGRPKGFEKYWADLHERIQADVQRGKILLRKEYIPDQETEVFFKAADVLALPYRYIYQSGVLFLGYSFGLPVLAADVGSLKEDIVEGETGFVFKPEDPVDLARVIENYFSSDLFLNLSARRPEIRDYAMKRNSWTAVGESTMRVYAKALGLGATDDLAVVEHPS